ncbi:hypothetical protein AAFF_G00093850 [Aldrovandia affinis]|uniref:Uncharacterized protein n=1 Tax=Aldrovandia affinis TaxID=143900 RepID=A0AAD7T2T7_9TELE|nr:hypothetical protein AAFF_G00093850 [Aldrovandia affinis]
MYVSLIRAQTENTLNSDSLTNQTSSAVISLSLLFAELIAGRQRSGVWAGPGHPARWAPVSQGPELTWRPPRQPPPPPSGPAPRRSAVKSAVPQASR